MLPSSDWNDISTIIALVKASFIPIKSFSAATFVMLLCVYMFNRFPEQIPPHLGWIRDYFTFLKPFGLWGCISLKMKVSNEHKRLNNTDDLFIVAPELYYTTNQYDVDVFETGKMSQREDLHELDEPNRDGDTSESCSSSSQFAVVSIKAPPGKVTGSPVGTSHLPEPTYYCTASTPLHTLKPYSPVAAPSFTSSYSDLLEWILSILKIQLHRQQFTELKSPQEQQHVNPSYISMQNPSFQRFPDREPIVNHSSECSSEDFLAFSGLWGYQGRLSLLWSLPCSPSCSQSPGPLSSHLQYLPFSGLMRGVFMLQLHLEEAGLSSTIWI